MKSKLILLLLVVCLLAPTLIRAQFGPPDEEQKEEKSENSVVKVPKFIRVVIEKVTEWQYILRQKLSELARELKRGNKLKYISWMLGIAFVFGLVHAAGPGHGKIFIVNYFIAEDVKAKKGFIAGIIFAFLHAFSGLLLVVILHLLLAGTKLAAVGTISGKVQTISYLILALLGIALFSKHLKTKEPAHSLDNKSFAAMILSLGLVPCPGSVMIALFSINIGIITIGVLMVLAMAGGMAVTISVFGILTILLKSSFLKLFTKHENLHRLIARILGLFGAFLLFIIGILFFVASV